MSQSMLASPKAQKPRQLVWGSLGVGWMQKFLPPCSYRRRRQILDKIVIIVIYSAQRKKPTRIQGINIMFTLKSLESCRAKVTLRRKKLPNKVRIQELLEVVIKKHSEMVRIYRFSNVL